MRRGGVWVARDFTVISVIPRDPPSRHTPVNLQSHHLPVYPSRQYVACICASLADLGTSTCAAPRSTSPALNFPNP